MAITKETIEDKIEVIGDYKIIQVRHATVIKEDDKVISTYYTRNSYSPNSDTSGASADVKAMVKHFHTDAIKQAYANHLSAS